MNHPLTLFAAFFIGACIGLAVGVDAQPQVTRYNFTYGPAPSTADLLRSH